MPGRILIVDPVSTNRIVMRVKMLAAKYQVDAVATCAEAVALVNSNPPDLILINLSDQTEGGHDFCRLLRQQADTAGIAIISVGLLDTSTARFEALDAGADDVLPRPISDTLLLARVRSLMRQRHTIQELQVRDGTSRNFGFGFEEGPAPRLAPAQITLLTDHPASASALAVDLRTGLRQPVRILAFHAALSQAAFDNAAPALLVIDATDPTYPSDALFRFTADLRARQATRQAAQIILLPRGESDAAAMMLDLGADNVVTGPIAPPELGLRVRKVLQVKARQDRTRDTLHDTVSAALIDPLTGLHNRRSAEAHLHRIAGETCAADGQYALLMIDIDHFKQVNDRYGHAAGDTVLCDLAARFRTCMRPKDLVARIGGEEFLIAMPHTTLSEAQTAAQRLRQAIGTRAFKIDGCHDVAVTVSVGVALHPHGRIAVTCLGDLSRRADAALYRAKSNGRDTVAICKTAA